MKTNPSNILILPEHMYDFITIIYLTKKFHVNFFKESTMHQALWTR